MTKKIKIILIAIFTIIIIAGVKFGSTKNDYFVDLEINRLFSKVNDAVVLVENNKEEEANNLQADILNAREAIKEFKSYAIEHEVEEYHKETIVSWGVKVDKIQQIVLNRIIDAIKIAEKTMNEKDIQNAKSLIPSNLPEVWKVEFEKRINKIK